MGKFAVANIDNEQKQLVPWAGIFSTYDGILTSRLLPLFNSEEMVQWMPQAIHKVRETVLARVDEGWPLPTVCELGVFFVDNSHRQESQHERAIRVILSTEKKHTPDHIIYAMRLNIE